MTGISYAASMMSAGFPPSPTGVWAAVTGSFVCWFYLSRFGIALFLGDFVRRVLEAAEHFTTLEFYELRFEGRPASLMRLWLAVRTSLIAMVAWTGISLLALVKISEPILGI